MELTYRAFSIHHAVRGELSFDASNLRNMCQFYQSFPIQETVSPKLDRSHYVRLTNIETVLADQKQLFASRYLPYLPTAAELQHQLERERALLQAKQEEQL